jgi:hypothetical protein
MQATFEEVVKAWLLDYDERLPSERGARIEAFVVLLGNLKDHGYEKDSLNNSRKEKIIGSCVNPFHPKQKLKRWVSMLVNALDSAIVVYYGTVKIRKDVVTPEMSAKIHNISQRAEESKALRTSGQIEADSDVQEDLLSMVTGKLDIECAVQEAVQNQPSQKEFMITDEMLDEMEAPEVIWDEDFYKKLGIEE